MFGRKCGHEGRAPWGTVRCTKTPKPRRPARRPRPHLGQRWQGQGPHREGEAAVSAASERRPPIGPVLRGIADLLAEWWLGFNATEPLDAVVPDDPAELAKDRP